MSKKKLLREDKLTDYNFPGCYGYEDEEVYGPQEIANDHEQREFEVDTDRTAEYESYKRRQVIK